MDPLIRCTLKFQDNPQEASTARAGRHPRPVGCVRDMSGSPKSRTELNIGGSGAKNCVEHHGKVRFGVALQKPTKNYKKPILKPTFLAIVHFWSGEQKSRFFFRRVTAGSLRRRAAPRPRPRPWPGSENFGYHYYDGPLPSLPGE